MKCWHRFDNGYQADEFPHAMAAMRIMDVTDSSGHEWYPDTGASAHVTSSIANLQHAQPYHGFDSVMIGDGNFLLIPHSGSTSIVSSSGNFPLKKVLVCHDIAKFLLSVSKLTKDYPCTFEFDCDVVRILDKAKKKLLTLENTNMDSTIWRTTIFKSTTRLDNKALVMKSNIEDLDIQILKFCSCCPQKKLFLSINSPRRYVKLVNLGRALDYRFLLLVLLLLDP